MPIVKIFGLSAGIRALPPKKANLFVLELSEVISREIAGVSELGITADQVSVFIVADHNITVGDVIIEVSGLYEKPERTHEVVDKLALILRCMVSDFLLEESVRFLGIKTLEVFVYQFDPAVSGFASGL